MKKKLFVMLFAGIGLVSNLLGQKKSEESDIKFEPFANISIPMGSDFKSFSGTGYGAGGKVLYKLDERFQLSGTAGFTYYLKKGNSDFASGSSFVIPITAGVRFYANEWLFVEPQIGYAFGSFGSDLLTTEKIKGNGMVISPMIGFINESEGDNTLVAYVQYNLYKPKILGVTTDMTNLSLHLGLNF